MNGVIKVPERPVAASNGCNHCRRAASSDESQQLLFRPVELLQAAMSFLSDASAFGARLCCTRTDPCNPLQARADYCTGLLAGMSSAPPHSK